MQENVRSTRRRDGMDWSAIERDYRSGTMSLREMAQAPLFTLVHRQFRGTSWLVSRTREHPRPLTGVMRGPDGAISNFYFRDGAITPENALCATSSASTETA